MSAAMTTVHSSPADGGSAVRHLTAADAEAFVRDVLFSASRTVPVVALTSWGRSGGFPLDPAAVARSLGEMAIVVAVRTGDDTWALSAALPARLDVFGGATRIWWPGLTRDSLPHRHPLLFSFTAADATTTFRRLVAAVVDGDARAGRSGPWAPAAATEVGPGPVTAVGPTTRGGRTVVSATVTSIDGTRIGLRVRGAPGVLVSGDKPLAELAASLTANSEIAVFRLSGDRDGLPAYSAQGLLGVPPPPGARPTVPDVMDGIVTHVGADGVTVRARGVSGRVTEADVPVERLATEVKPGETLRVRRLSRPGEGEVAYSIRGLMPDPWRRVGAVYRAGDVVRGRVCRIEEKFALIEVLPGAALLAPANELDWTHVRRVADILRVGEHVRVRILELDVRQRRGTVSFRQGLTAEPLPAVAPGPGQPVFLGDDEFRPNRGGSDADAPVEDAQMRAELDQALEDRRDLLERLKAASDQLVEARREVRSLEDQVRGLEQRASGDLDPLSSEVAFLTAVRVEYARKLNESSRMEFPLHRMAVGKQFLESVRKLDGLPVEKVIEVCAQVACQRAHQVPGREVHPLRSGPAGAPARVRTRDGAKAWRCSLQDNTASARRLHWWDVPRPDGRVIEFASVGVHDEMEIPE